MDFAKTSSIVKLMGRAFKLLVPTLMEPRGRLIFPASLEMIMLPVVSRVRFWPEKLTP
jgi:hypothetical protein